MQGKKGEKRGVDVERGEKRGKKGGRSEGKGGGEGGSGEVCFISFGGWTPLTIRSTLAGAAKASTASTSSSEHTVLRSRRRI